MASKRKAKKIQFKNVLEIGRLLKTNKCWPKKKNKKSGNIYTSDLGFLVGRDINLVPRSTNSIGSIHGGKGSSLKMIFHGESSKDSDIIRCKITCTW